MMRNVPVTFPVLCIDTRTPIRRVSSRCRRNDWQVTMKFRTKNGLYQVAHGCLLILLSASALSEPLRIAPDWNLETAQADNVRLSERAEDQISVLFFWATWCPYCKALMPHLQSIRLEFGDEVEILAINIMDDGDPVAFLNGAGYDFVLLLDGDEVADAYGVRGTPGVFVVDGNRRVHFDLGRLPPLTPPSGMETSSHPQKAAYLAPYWAAEIRKSIDEIGSSD